MAFLFLKSIFFCGILLPRVQVLMMTGYVNYITYFRSSATRFDIKANTFACPENI